MKILTYQIEGYTAVCNPKTEEVEQQLSIAEVRVECKTQAEFDANYPIAEKEAFGSITVEGEFDNETENATTDDVLNALLGVTE